MRSQLADRLGVEVPQLVHLPPDVASLAAAEEAIELADSYGLCDGHPLDESQRFTLRAGLGERSDGSWAATTVADFEPRQNGKNDTCNGRELAGLILFGERLIIHTAHEFPTANESFLRLVGVFEAWDDLRSRVARIRYANGEQGIELLTGQRIKYKARTGGSGRGFAQADLVVYDEAQHLQAEHVAASGPARLANPNSQSWYMGSGGLSSSRQAWRLRRRALEGDAGRLAYVEHTAEAPALVDGRVVSSRPDVTSREAWAQANPAYGRRITDEAMSGLFDELGEDLFGRECLCLWDPEPGQSQTLPELIGWPTLIGPAPAGATEKSVDVSPGGRSAAISHSDGARLQVLRHDVGVDWVVPLLLEHRVRLVWLDPSGPAGQLVQPLTNAGIKIGELSTRDHVQACGGFATAVKDSKVTHCEQPALTAAVVNADRRDVGDGGWLWSRRRSSIDISPLVAITIAWWAANQPKKRSGVIW